MNYDLHLGDCLEYMRGLPDGAVDAVVTDPPYGTNVTVWDESITSDIVRECLRVSRGYCLFFYANTRLYHILKCIQDAGFDAWTMVWHKPNAMQIARKFSPQWTPIVCAYKSGVQFWGQDFMTCAIVPQGIDHPTPKPLSITKWLVTKATQPGATVFDPFMGSGTTGVACMQTGRRFIGCEIDPGYFAIAQRRIEQAAMQPPLIPHAAPAAVQLEAWA